MTNKYGYGVSILSCGVDKDGTSSCRAAYRRSLILVSVTMDFYRRDRNIHGICPTVCHVCACIK